MTETLATGVTAPDFDLPAAGGGRVSLAELRSRAERGVVVYFYPAASTPGCTTQACDFRDNLASLRGAGYEVVGVSPDPVPDLDRFAEEQGLTFPLASDEDHSVLEAYGAWGEKTRYGRTSIGVLRSTVVVAPDGTVALARHNVTAKGHVARLRTALGLDG